MISRRRREREREERENFSSFSWKRGAKGSAQHTIFLSPSSYTGGMSPRTPPFSPVARFLGEQLSGKEKRGSFARFIAEILPLCKNSSLKVAGLPRRRQTRNFLLNVLISEIHIPLERGEREREERERERE